MLINDRVIRNAPVSRRVRATVPTLLSGLPVEFFFCSHTFERRYSCQE